MGYEIPLCFSVVLGMAVINALCPQVSTIFFSFRNPSVT